jgi:hypothetical protein
MRRHEISYEATNEAISEAGGTLVRGDTAFEFRGKASWETHPLRQATAKPSVERRLSPPTRSSSAQFKSLMETIEQRLGREIERLIDASGIAGYETALAGSFRALPR